jgi:hypothetical protein
MGLFRRAGIEPIRTGLGATALLLGQAIENPDPLPRPFSTQMLLKPEQNGAWVAQRLSVYEGVEQIRKLPKSGRDFPVDLLARSPTPHSALATIDIIEALTKKRDVRAVIQTLNAVIAGPHDEAFKDVYRSSLTKMSPPVRQVRAI